MVVKTGVIVKSAWKNKKAGDVVEYKGEEYTIGVDAFATVEAAVEADCVSGLVIVDKKLTSPVDGRNIESAATDIFESTVKDEVSKDGKTETRTVKFTAAAGGTAVMGNDARLTGFEKVTVTDAGGVFFGGKHDISLTVKQVDDPDNVLSSFDVTASLSTAGTGSLSVTGESTAEMAGITVEGIADSAGNTGEIIDVIGNIYALASGEDDYEAAPAASYANVALRNVLCDNSFNGGSVTEKAVMKTSENAEIKKSEEYTYTYSEKTGSGTVALTDAGAGEIFGYKSVKITNQDLEGDLQVGDIIGGSRNESYSFKKNYVKDKSFSSDASSTLTTTVAGTLSASGREDHWVTTNDLDMLSSASLKHVQFSDPDENEVYAWSGSGKKTVKISAAKKGEDTAFTYSYRTDESLTAKSSLTAESSVLGKLEGLKTLTATDTQFKSANSMETKSTTTQKNTGVALNGITEDMTLADLDPDKSQTYEYTVKTDETAVGTATLTDSSVQGGDLSGFKTLKIVWGNYEDDSGFGSITAGSTTSNVSTKTSYDVDKSASYDNSTKTTCAAAGTLTVIGNGNLPIHGDVLNYSSVNIENATIAGTIGMTEPSTSINAKKVSVTAQGDNNAITVATDQETITTAVGSLTAKSSDLGALSYIKTISITDSKIASAEANNTKNTYSTNGTGFTDEEIVQDVKNLDIKAIKHTQPFTTREFTREENAVGGTSFKFAGKTIGEDNNIFIHGYKSVSLENSNADEKGVLTAVLQNRSTAAEELKTISFNKDSSFRGDLKYKAHSKAEGDAVLKGNTATLVNWFASVKVIGTNYETQLTGFIGKDTQVAQLTQFQTGKPRQSTMDAEYSVNNEWGVDGSENHKLVSTLEASKAVITGGCENLKTVKLKNVNLADGASFVNAGAGNSDSHWSEYVKWLSNDPQDPDLNIVNSVDNWPYDDPVAQEYIDRVTYVDKSEDNTKKAGGDFTLDNDENSSVENLFVAEFKNVAITLAAPTAVSVNTLSLDGDTVDKASFKYRASEEKKTLDRSGSDTSTATGTLKVTGKSTADGVTALNMTGNGLGFADITLKDAVIAGTDVVSESYVEKSSYTISESVAADGSASVKVTNTCSKTGNGKFTAAVANTVAGVPVTVFEGTLKGYGNISIKDVSIGNADNFKRGGAGRYLVPVSCQEYFDVYAYNKTEPWPVPRPDGTEVVERGDVTGSYTLASNGDVDSDWTVTTSATAAGSFTLDAKIAGAAAGNISGYDKVTLSGVATVGNINGVNSIDSTEMSYKTENGNVASDIVITTETKTSASSVKLTGKKIGGAMQQITAGNITGYKSVSLVNATVGALEADNSDYSEIADNLSGSTVTNIAWASIGTLTATDSIIGDKVNGFQTVKLTNTAAEVDFDGTSVASVEDSEKELPISFENKATGSFTAQYTGKNPEAGFAVGNVSGYKQVKLTDYSAEVVAAGGTLLDSYVTSLTLDQGDEQEGTPDVLKLSAATRSNSFTATAKVNTSMTVGDVYFYGKVEATGLESIGSVFNAKRSDDILFDKRKYSNMHYGEGNMTKEIYPLAEKITSMNFDATGASVTIRGTAARKGVEAQLTAVTGHILGYGKTTLSNVVVGGEAPSHYAGGKYAYTSKTDKDDKFIATSTSTAVGKLSISSATAASDAAFAVEGFKNVSIDITAEGTAAPVFTSIVGGTETAQLTNGNLDYTTYTVSGTLDLATVGGTVNNVAGFEKVNLKDTNAGTIEGYAVTAKKNGDGWEQEIVGKSAVTFENTTAAGNTIDIIDNAKSVTFKAWDDADTDFDVGAILSSEEVDMDILIEKCQAVMDLQNFDLNNGDKIKLSSAGKFGDGTWSTIEFDGLTADTLASYFDNIEGTSFSGKGTLLAAVTEDQFETAVAGKVEIGKNIAFQSLLA